MISLNHYLILSAALFSLGVFAVITRRNAIGVLMGIELILNAANINMVAFSRFGETVGGASWLTGQVFSLFIIVVAAAEATVTLAIVLAIYRILRTINIDEVDLLKK